MGVMGGEWEWMGVMGMMGMMATQLKLLIINC